MSRIRALALVPLLATACYSRVYSYPDPLPPPPPPPVAEQAPPPMQQQQQPINVTITQPGYPQQGYPQQGYPQQGYPQGYPGYATVYQYWGEHPIPYEQGGGWCVIEGAHQHPYAPVYNDQYVYRDNTYYFGADVEFSFDYGHPVPPEFGGGWCNISGPHRHRYRPTADYDYDNGRRIYVYRPNGGVRRVGQGGVVVTQPSNGGYRPQPSYPGGYPGGYQQGGYQQGNVREVPYGQDNRPAQYTPQPTYPNGNVQRPQPSYPNGGYQQGGYQQGNARGVPYGNDVQHPAPYNPGGSVQPTPQQPVPQQPAQPARPTYPGASTPAQPPPQQPNRVPYGDDVRPSQAPQPVQPSVPGNNGGVIRYQPPAQQQPPPHVIEASPTPMQPQEPAHVRDFPGRVIEVPQVHGTPVASQPSQPTATTTVYQPPQPVHGNPQPQYGGPLPTTGNRQMYVQPHPGNPGAPVMVLPAQAPGNQGNGNNNAKKKVQIIQPAGR